MIIVTGTKRSGTSMWMQLLHAGGVQIVGEAFSRDWADTIRDANPNGFYESPLRRGIYYATNPSPKTGVYLRAEQVRLVGVKVFIPGLVRTERAYIHRVVATMRNWREYGDSLRRLTSMERDNRAALGKKVLTPIKELNPALDWWRENYMLVRDVAIRQYPVAMVAYDTVLQEPERALREVFQFLGHGDAAAALMQVKPESRTQQDREIPDGISPETADIFDELYRRIRVGVPIDAEFIGVLNDLAQKLEPVIQAELREIRRQANERKVAFMKEQAQAAARAATTDAGDDEHDDDDADDSPAAESDGP
jgi:hypothetical protein